MGFRLFFVSMAAVSSLCAADISIIDEIICKVNGEIVTRGDYERTRRQLEGSLRQQGAAGTALADAMKLGEKNILRERIDQLLLQTKGKEIADYKDNLDDAVDATNDAINTANDEEKEVAPPPARRRPQ